MNVYEKLSQVQSELKAPKTQHNKFGDFNYRSCEDILEAVKPILKKVNAILTISDDIVVIGERFYIKATAAFTDTEGEAQVTATAYAREPLNRPKMDEAQVTGSSSSYARKYALNGLFCIDDNKDPDTTNTGQNRANTKPQAQQQSKPADNIGSRTQRIVRLSPGELSHLQETADRKGVAYSSICQRYHCNSISEITPDNYLKALAALAKMPDIAPTQEDFREDTPSVRQEA